MSVIYRAELRVDSRDVDLFNQARPSAVLGLMQEAATLAAQALKVDGPRLLEKYGSLWMVTRNWVELEAPLRWDDRVTVETWHRGGAGASVYRDFEFFRDGKYVGQATSIWAIVHAEDRRVLPMKRVEEFAGTDGGERIKSVRLRGAHMPETFDGRESRRLGYSDTDLNGHVNNVHYADYACDALHLERMDRGKFIRGFQIDYVSECRAGETLQIDTAARDGELFAQGVGEDGVKRFDFDLTLADLQ